MKSDNKQKGGFLGGLLMGVAIAAAVVVTGPGGIGALVANGGLVPGVATKLAVGGAIGGIFGAMTDKGAAGGAVGPNGQPLTPAEAAAAQDAGAAGADSAAAKCASLQQLTAQLQQQYTAGQQALSQARAEGASKVSADQSLFTISGSGNTSSCSAGGTNPALAACENNSDAQNTECANIKNQCLQIATFVQATQSAICTVQNAQIQNGTATSSTDEINAQLGIPTATISATSTQTKVASTTVIANVGDAVSYTWSSKNADSFTSTFTSDKASCGTQNNTATASGYDSGFVAPASAGCTYFISYTAKNSTSGQIATALLTLKVNSATSTTAVAGCLSGALYNTITGAACSTTTSNTNTTGAFSLSLSPSTVAQGGNVNISAKINSSAVNTYSIKTYQNGQLLGYLASGVQVGSTQRPVSIEKTFNTSLATPPGTYTMQIVNDANANEAQTANLVVVAASGQTTSGTGYTPTNTAINNTVTSNGGSCNSIVNDLQVGSDDSYTYGQVGALQSFLISKGYLTMPPGVATGYFGALTKSAVIRFQKAFGISPTGYFGPISRARMQTMCN